MTVKWYGDELLKQIEEATPDGLFEGGQMLVDAAAAKAPRVSGDLVDSRFVISENKSTFRPKKSHGKKPKVKPGEAVAGFAIFYARFVEFGTKSKPARPFLRPALDELKEQIGAKIVTKIGSRLK